MISIVRILPEVKGEKEVNIENEERKYKNSHPNKNERNDCSTHRNAVCGGTHSLSSTKRGENQKWGENQQVRDTHSLLRDKSGSRKKAKKTRKTHFLGSTGSGICQDKGGKPVQETHCL